MDQTEYEKGYNYFIKNGNIEIPVYSLKAVKAFIDNRSMLYRKNEEDKQEYYDLSLKEFVLV